MKLEVEFLGAAGEVTGSATRLTVQDRKKSSQILVDYGGKVGGKREDMYRANSQNYPGAIGQLDGMVLTHGHFDHNGRLAFLVEDGFEGKIITTPETREISEVILSDSQKIMVGDYKIIASRRLHDRIDQNQDRPNKKGRKDKGYKNRERRKSPKTDVLRPPFSQESVEKAISLMNPANYKEEFRVSKLVRGRLFNAGHILGSASVQLDLGPRTRPFRYLDTGDIGNIHKDSFWGEPEVPTDELDAVAIEGTYGDREHSEREDSLAMLKASIIETLKRDGKVVIPAFALEKTQNILAFLAKEIRDINIQVGRGETKIFLDSPMAAKFTDIYSRHLPEEDSIGSYKGFEIVTKADRSDKVYGKDPNPCIIISSAGMCEAGPVRSHLANTLQDSRNSILFVGYPGSGTLASQILACDPNAPASARQVSIDRHPFVVNARIARFDAYSSHADRTQLLGYLERIIFRNNGEAAKIFIKHSPKEVAEKFRQDILNRLRFLREDNVIIPEKGTIYSLAS